MGVYYGKADFINYGKPSLFLDFANKKSLVDRISGQNLITFSRTSSGTYVDSDGLIKTASANQPRFDHDPVTGESLGLLVEEERTNSILNSNTGNPELPSEGVATSTSSVGPDNTTSATQVVVSSDQINTGLRWEGWIGTTSNVRSFYVKVLSGSGVTITGQGGLGDPYTWNISNLSYSSDARHPTGGVIPVGNGWYRCWIGPNSATEVNTGGGTFLVPVSVGTYLFWGFQVETGSFPTSYIPTTTAAVTRTADTASITGSNFSRWYNQNEGSILWEGIYNNSISGSDTIFTVTNSSAVNNNRFSIRAGNTLATSNGSEIFSGWTTGISENTNYKIGFAYKSQSYAFAAAGTIRNTSSSSSIPSGLNQIEFSKIEGDVIRNSGTFNRFIYYPTRLTDTQLQQLTE